MRQLTFSNQNGLSTAELFAMLHESLLFTSKELNKQDFRKHAKLLGMFEEDTAAIVLESRGGITLYGLKEGTETVLLLEEADWEFLKSCVEAVKFTAIASRKVVKLYDFLDNAPEVKPSLVKE